MSGRPPGTPRPEPLDVGLQRERTILAWRRTALSITIIAAVSLRVIPPVLGAWSFALCASLLIVAGWLLFTTERHYRLLHRGYETPAQAEAYQRHGPLVAMTTLVCLGTGAAATVFVVVLSQLHAAG